MREILFVVAIIAMAIAAIYHALLLIDSVGWLFVRWLNKNGWLR
jgi:hypothetical protein